MKETPPPLLLEPVSVPRFTKATRFQILVALGVLYLVWGSTYLAIGIAVQTIPPFLMSALRYLVAGVLLYAWLRLRGVPAPKLIHWRSAAVIGLFLLGGGNGGVVWAEQSVPSGLTALLVSVAPLWMVFIDWFRPNGHRPSGPTFAGIFLGFLGLIILIGVKSVSMSGVYPPHLIGLLISPITWAIGSVYARQAKLPDSPFMSTALEMLAGGVVLSLMSFASGELRDFHPRLISPASWKALIYLIIVGALIGFSAYIFLLKHTPLAVASTYAYINPVVAVFLGWSLAGEVLTSNTFLGGAIILVAVAIITLGQSKRPETS